MTLRRLREASVKIHLPSRESGVRWSFHQKALSLSGVVLTLLGPPTVCFADGGPVTPPLGAKALALFTYLVLEEGAHTREELAGLLWGDSLEVEARASLRQALKRLREALGEVVEADRRMVAVVEPVECDILDFRRAVEREPERAVTIEVPRFLQGFSIRHAPQFDEWAGATRGVLFRQYQQALGTLARAALAERRWRDAVKLADRWLDSDPLAEEPARLGIEARYLSGDRGAALAAFSDYRSNLFRETGCEPGRGLLALIRRVETDAVTGTSTPAAEEWNGPTPTFEASLIGREKEWASLLRSWNSARQGKGGIVLLEGEAGVGKSRLAEEFLRWVVADGGTVLHGRGYDARAGIPYGPMVEVLQEGLDAPGLTGTSPEWLTEVARLLPELRRRFSTLPEPSPPADSAEGWRLFEGVAQLLSSLASERPVLVSIDDLQWCDGDSCNLIRFLTRRLERVPVLWLGTFTLGELERDAPSARLCRVLRARAHAEPISIGPLSEEQLWRMMREMGHVSSPTGARRFASRVFRITGGNPFYAIELLKTMFGQGLLQVDEDTGEWIIPSGGLGQGREFPVSRTVHDVIAERIERMPEELQDVLITIAVAGAGCRPDVLSHVHGISRLHAAWVSDALAERRLVVEQGGVYRCAHPVIAHVVRDGLTDSRRREVNRVLAVVLELVTPPDELSSVAGEIARHADRGAEPALAYRFALIASDASVRRFAFEEALAWLDLAATSARSKAETDAVNRLTAEVLEVAGWSEAPAGSQRMPITRELVTEDLDLRVRG
jgi:DNA-binding SARP family transcriptional activator